MLWPESDEKHARGSVSQLLMELRRDFGAAAFLSRGDVVEADASLFVCDAVLAFDAADAGDDHGVLVHATAELLPGFALEGADGFNDWLDAMRRTLNDTVADCAWRVAQAARTDADRIAALDLCARLRPFDEAVLRRRMQTYAATGNTAQAAAIYEQHRAKLRDQLGVTLSRETRTVFDSICALSDVAAEMPRLVERSAEHAAGSTLEPAGTALHRMKKTYAAAALLVLILVSALFVHDSTRDRRARGAVVDVALAEFGRQDEPLIRTMPGLVASYLMRDSAMRVGYGTTIGARYQVLALLRTTADDTVTGTVEVRTTGGAIISSTTIDSLDRVHADTVAARIAEFVAASVPPARVRNSPDTALHAAQRHLLYAKADFARGALDRAKRELERAAEQLDTVSLARRDRVWTDVSAAVREERCWQVGDACRATPRDAAASESF